jgi:prostaglandin-H2 D-isomerase / glutathione transferase
VAQIHNKTDKYKNETAPAFYKQIAIYYAENNGPFLLGDKVTYVDYAVYQSLDNNEKLGILPVSHTPYL